MRDRVSPPCLSLSLCPQGSACEWEREAHLLLLLLLLLLLCLQHWNCLQRENLQCYPQSTGNLTHTHTHTNTHTAGSAQWASSSDDILSIVCSNKREQHSEWESVLNLTHTRTHKQAYKYFMCKHCINISVCWYCFYSTPSFTHVLPLSPAATVCWVKCRINT